MAGEDAILEMQRDLACAAKITAGSSESYWHHWKYQCPLCPHASASRESIRVHLYKHDSAEIKDAWIAQTLATS